MSVSTYTPTTSGNTAKIDGNFAVLTRLGDAFAPHGQSTPDMTVRLDAGHVFDGTTLTEVAPQSTGTITAPASDSRIDRVVVNRLTGAVSVVTGTASASPVAPAIPAGTVPIAQVLLASTTVVIENGMITDERDLNGLGVPAAGGHLLNVQTFTSSGTYTPTTGTTKVIVEVLGGGGSGGGCAATSATQGSAAGGGGSGSFAKALLTSGFSGVAVTVGSGGAATSAGAVNGNAGGTSSFGSLVSAPGGNGGFSGPAFTPPALSGGSALSTAATGGNIANSVGQQGLYGFALGILTVVGGTGAPSVLGGGGGAGGYGNGAAAHSPGAGGGGASAIRSSSAFSGGAGANGIVIVYEYA